MPRLDWRYEAEINAAPDEVYAWLSDHRADDHRSEAFRRGAKLDEGDAPVVARETLRHEGDRLTIKDTWGRLTLAYEATLDPVRREVRINGTHGYHATWRAEALDDGRTRVVSMGELDPEGVFGLLMPVVGKGYAEHLERDFWGHVEEMRDVLEGG